ncbi:MULTISPECIES: hypothetical protein [unclassified Streptomyces]|nr:hypothetical protein [Streptomyces sp. NBC_00273]
MPPVPHWMTGSGMIGRAAELFSTARLDGQSVEEYEYRVTG